jgi:hypothetical protein
MNNSMKDLRINNSMIYVINDFDSLDRYDITLMLPLSAVLNILGFDLVNQNKIDYIAHIRDKYLNHPKYGFTPNDFKYEYKSELTLSFSINGFKKLSLVYSDSPRYKEIVQYFCNK